VPVNKVAGATPKENRMYRHIRQAYVKAGKPITWARRVAASTVNAYRTRMGQTKAQRAARRGRG
jgi:hypothetical protein